MTRTEAWAHGIRKDVMENDKDAVILLTGPERMGKSNLAFWIGGLIDPTFDHTRMVYSGKDFISMARELPKGSVIVLDEAIMGGFGRDAMTNQNKDLAKFLIVAGERNLIVVICFPNIRFIDSYIKDHRAHYWILIEKRGQGKLHRRRRADYPGAKTSWPAMWRLSNIPKMVGPEWEAYLAEKSDMVRGIEKGEAWAPDQNEVRRLAAQFKMLLHRE